MKKILTLSLAALMAFSAPANAVFAAPATKVEAASVNLKAAAATAVSTAEDLKAMESNPSGNYYLAKDIKLPADFQLFGDRDHPFKGQLDGKGHKLTGYTYKSSTWAENAGIFGYANGAVFKNISGYAALRTVPLIRSKPPERSPSRGKLLILAESYMQMMKRQ